MLFEYRRTGSESVGLSVDLSHYIYKHFQGHAFVFYSTKQVSRFHPPYVLEAMKLLAQHTDQLKINAKSAWNDFLT